MGKIKNWDKIKENLWKNRTSNTHVTVFKAAKKGKWGLRISKGIGRGSKGVHTVFYPTQAEALEVATNFMKKQPYMDKKEEETEEWEYYRTQGIRITPELKAVVHQFRRRVNKAVDTDWRGSKINGETEYALQKLSDELYRGYPEMDEDFALFRRNDYAPLRNFKSFETLFTKHKDVLRFLYVDSPGDVDPYTN